MKGSRGGRSGGRGTQPVDGSAWPLIFELLLNVKSLCSQKPDSSSTQEDHRTKFYEMYRHEAEEYDREFIKRCDEDLNTTLIFVCFLCSLCLRHADSRYRPVCSPP